MKQENSKSVKVGTLQLLKQTGCELHTEIKTKISIINNTLGNSNST